MKTGKILLLEIIFDSSLDYPANLFSVVKKNKQIELKLKSNGLQHGFWNYLADNGCAIRITETSLGYWVTLYYKIDELYLSPLKHIKKNLALLEYAESIDTYGIYSCCVTTANIITASSSSPLTKMEYIFSTNGIEIWRPYLQKELLFDKKSYSYQEVIYWSHNLLQTFYSFHNLYSTKVKKHTLLSLQTSSFFKEYVLTHGNTFKIDIKNLIRKNTTNSMLFLLETSINYRMKENEILKKLAAFIYEKS